MSAGTAGAVKMCTRCLKFKPLTEFHRDRRTASGRKSECKDCPSVIATHGYGGYTRGCRCDTCREAKAAYMRDRRATAFLVADDGPVEGIKHGTIFGYTERGCRCDACVKARRADWYQCSRKSRGAA